MNKEYIKPSMEIIVFDEHVFTNDLTVSGGSLTPGIEQDEW